MSVLRRPQGTAVWFVEFTDQAVVKVDLPDAFAFGAQRYLITSQSFTQEAHATAPIDFSFLLHPTQRPTFGIARGQDTTIGPQTAAPALRRGALSQGFMRAFVIIVL